MSRNGGCCDAVAHLPAPQPDAEIQLEFLTGPLQGKHDPVIAKAHDRVDAGGWGRVLVTSPTDRPAVAGRRVVRLSSPPSS
ncbi:hypothetical protein ACIHCQ_29970 [Streptomyces sp. NPDC052236]|uniref:hypothetical protein n=1 Tax=Streptomyces sp. NPDC052236 TaxID=3365686 RepID=UPI0037D0402B